MDLHDTPGLGAFYGHVARDVDIAFGIERLSCGVELRRRGAHQIVLAVLFVEQVHLDVFQFDGGRIADLTHVLRLDEHALLVALEIAVGPVLRSRVDVFFQWLRKNRRFADEFCDALEIRHADEHEDSEDSGQEEPPRAAHSFSLKVSDHRR